MKRPARRRSWKRRIAEGICEADCVNPRQVAAARRAAPVEPALRAAAAKFHVLSNPSRLRILLGLDGRELCVCDLAALLDLSMAGTSQQLKELRNAGAVEYRAQGKLAFYRIADPAWLALARSALDGAAGDSGLPSLGRTLEERAAS